MWYVVLCHFFVLLLFIIVGYRMVLNEKFICTSTIARKIVTNEANLAILVSFERRESHLSIDTRNSTIEWIHG